MVGGVPLEKWILFKRLDRDSISHPRSKSRGKLSARQPDLPHPGNGRDGEAINRGKTQTKTVIAAVRNDGMNNQFRDRRHSTD
jgi:hypothetical protein